MTAETASAGAAPSLANVSQDATRVPGEPKSRSWLVRALVLVIAVAWTVPTAGLLISSLRPEVDVSGTGWWTIFAHPFELTQFTVANYERVLTAEGLFGAFINSLIVTIPATVIPITLAAFAAYGFAWTRFRGRSFLFAIVVGLLVVPLQMSLVPLLRLYGNYDLVGTFVGVWLAHTGFGLPLATMPAMRRVLRICVYVGLALLLLAAIAGVGLYRALQQAPVLERTAGTVVVRIA